MDKVTGHMIMIQQITIEALLAALKDTHPDTIKRYEDKRGKLLDAYGEANPEIKGYLEQLKAETAMQ